MKLHNAVLDKPIVSNVGEIGEFRIRNSAKAFNILSSGLYANKIRAIIRELSCNAVDSHIAAGKQDTPFDVHLPNQLEPWFSIRDYGTGLNHDQVTNIYTTYFESTKTNSNDFIGALGLGSKSPFSYTDNFTVTAIQNGRKGIYSAFINDVGVPSIALMNEEQVTEPNGVEVKFSVNDRYDFHKFEEELAKKINSVTPVNTAKEDLTEVIAKATRGRGVDLVFECTGNEKVAASVFEHLRPGGTVVHIGLPLENTSWDLSAAIVKEARVEHVFRYAHVYQKALDLTASGKLDAKPLITHHFNFSDSIAAFDFAKNMPPDGIKVHINMDK